MSQKHSRKWLVQVGVVALLACSSLARADSCAGGADATGNDCTGQQAALAASEAQSHSLYLQGQAALAELRVTRAKQRLMEATAALKSAEAAVRSEEAELKTARMAMQADEQREHRHLAARAPQGR